MKAKDLNYQVKQMRSRISGSPLSKAQKKKFSKDVRLEYVDMATSPEDCAGEHAQLVTLTNEFEKALAEQLQAPEDAVGVGSGDENTEVPATEPTLDAKPAEAGEEEYQLTETAEDRQSDQTDSPPVEPANEVTDQAGEEQSLHDTIRGLPPQALLRLQDVFRQHVANTIGSTEVPPVLAENDLRAVAFHRVCEQLLGLSPDATARDLEACLVDLNTSTKHLQSRVENLKEDKLALKRKVDHCMRYVVSDDLLRRLRLDPDNLPQGKLSEIVTRLLNMYLLHQRKENMANELNQPGVPASNVPPPPPPPTSTQLPEAASNEANRPAGISLRDELRNRWRARTALGWQSLAGVIAGVVATAIMLGIIWGLVVIGSDLLRTDPTSTAKAPDKPAKATSTAKSDAQASDTDAKTTPPTTEASATDPSKVAAEPKQPSEYEKWREAYRIESEQLQKDLEATVTP